MPPLTIVLSCPTALTLVQFFLFASFPLHASRSSLTTRVRNGLLGLRRASRALRLLSLRDPGLWDVLSSIGCVCCDHRYNPRAAVARIHRGERSFLSRFSCPASWLAQDWICPHVFLEGFPESQLARSRTRFPSLTNPSWEEWAGRQSIVGHLSPNLLCTIQLYMMREVSAWITRLLSEHPEWHSSGGDPHLALFRVQTATLHPPPLPWV